MCIAAILRGLSKPSANEILDSVIGYCEELFDSDVIANKKMGSHGAKKLLGDSSGRG